MEMAGYINSHCQTYLPEKDVFDSVMLKNPVPSNVDKPQVMDDFTAPLMSKAETSVDISLEKIQQKITNIMRPLSHAWKAIDIKNDETGEMTLSLGDIAMSLDKTMLLIGQAFQATAYHRRFNALAPIMKDHRKETLKEKQDLLIGEHKKLFGISFNLTSQKM